MNLDIDWHLTDICSFRCEYCHPPIRAFKNRPLPYNKSPGEVASSFDSLDRRCTIYMSGGEPFQYPEFTRLCELLTERHKIGINTNLSQGIEEFIARIDPEKVKLIFAAIHIMERERLGLSIDDFADKVVKIQDAGFPIQVSYVLYPPLMPRFEQDSNLLLSMGVKDIALKYFKGTFNHKRYPEGYTEEELGRIINFSGNNYESKIAYIKQGQESFLGRMCSAGKDSIKVLVDGTIMRCPSVKGNYGNLFLGTARIDEILKACPAKRVLTMTWCNKYVNP